MAERGPYFREVVKEGLSEEVIFELIPTENEKLKCLTKTIESRG